MPYVFLGTEEQLQKGLAGEAVRMAMDVRWQRDLQRWAGGSSKELFSDVGCLGKKLWHMYQEGQESGFVTEEAENRHVAQGEVVALTGCRSDQTSADVGDVSSFGLQGGSGGALSSALLEALKVGLDTLRNSKILIITYIIYIYIYKDIKKKRGPVHSVRVCGKGRGLPTRTLRHGQTTHPWAVGKTQPTPAIYGGWEEPAHRAPTTTQTAATAPPGAQHRSKQPYFPTSLCGVLILSSASACILPPRPSSLP